MIMTVDYLRWLNLVGNVAMEGKYGMMVGVGCEEDGVMWVFLV